MRFRFTLINSIEGSYILSTDPKGWDEGEFIISRSKQFHGIMFQRTFTLSFFCNGAGREFIDNIYDTQGIDAIIQIKVEVACGCNEVVTTGGDYSDDYSDDYSVESSIAEDCDFEEIFLGELDLKEYCRDERFTNVRIVEAGQAQQILSKFDTKIDILADETLDGTALDPLAFNGYTMILHGKQIIIQSALGITGTSQYTEGAPLVVGNEIRATPPFEDVIIDDLNGIGVPTDFVTDVASNQSLFINSGESRTLDVNYSIIGTFSEAAADDREYTLRLVIRAGGTPDGAPLTEIANYGTLSANGGDPIVQNINETGTLTLGLSTDHFYYLYLELIPTDLGFIPIVLTAITFSCTTCSFEVVDDDLRPDTECVVSAVYETGARISQAITNELDPFRSTYLGRTNAEPYAESAQGCGSFMAFTNGLMIRQYPLTGTNAKTISISMNEYFKTLDAIHDMGIGIELRSSEYKIVMERKEYFYDSTVLFQLSNVPDIKRCVAIDYFLSQVDIGYETWENEESNGIDEFNTVRQYDLGFRNVPTKLEKKSPSIASGYAIEYTRRKPYSENSTTDYKYDNNLFVVCLNREIGGFGHPIGLEVTEKDENFPTVNNLISPETSYNLRISPARNFLRHFNTIIQGLLKYPARLIKFTYGEGNYKMESDQENDTCPGYYNNVLFSEEQDIQWDEANVGVTPLWEPEFIEFEYPLTFEQFRLVRASPYKTIEFSSGTTTYEKGFIIELKYNPLGGLTQFKLLKAYGG